jgi:hypothetical protein
MNTLFQAVVLIALIPLVVYIIFATISVLTQATIATCYVVGKSIKHSGLISNTSIIIFLIGYAFIMLSKLNLI